MSVSRAVRAWSPLVLLALVAALSACAGAAPAETPRASASASPTPTPTATPAAAPSVRVPATCDQLVPQDVVAGAFRVAVEPVRPPHPRSPGTYADERAGVLTCSWSSDEVGFSVAPGAIYGWVTVVPDATRADVEDMLGGSMFGDHEPLSSVPDTTSSCSALDFQWCGFIAYSDRYSVIGGVWDYGDATLESQQKVIDALASASVPVVRTLASPEPLWQPPGVTLTGATACEGMLTDAQIESITGWTGVHDVKSDGGENALSTLRTNARVHSYLCSWAADQTDVSLTASVLPGGASYAIATRPAGAVEIDGLGDAAFRSAGDGSVDVIAAGGWVQVEAPVGAVTDDMLLALARQELANVGYTG